MNVVCDNCQTKIKIPDEKLKNIPKGQVFTINCPKCKKKISAELSPKQADSQAKDGSFEMPSADIEDERPFDFLEEGAEIAMICESDDSMRDIVRRALEDMGYHISEPKTPRDALKQMRFQDFHVVVLNELFGTTDPDMNHVLKFIEQMKMYVRRNMFVTLLSNRFQTMDNMIAYNKSVNLILNTKNIKDADKILKRGLSDNAAFYRIYKETMARIGKV